MVKVGFTGTQHGMSLSQKNAFIDIIKKLIIEEFHHGDCIGADSQAHSFIRHYKKTTTIICHPPVIALKRAYRACDEYRDKKSYLARDHDIVDETEILIATPKGTEIIPSGTWSTIRYARKKGRSIIIISPKGRTKKEE